MAARYTADILTFVIGLGIIYIGASFLIAPESTASTFGLPSWPHGEAAAFLNVKGIRDIASGVLPLTLFALGQRRALGWSMLVAAMIPLGDGTIILAWGGSAATAIGIHYATSAACVVAGVFYLRIVRGAEVPAARSAPVVQPEPA